MLWILRRTRVGLTSAASLLNGINNNENRPAHKGYDKLSPKDDFQQQAHSATSTNQNNVNNDDDGVGVMNDEDDDEMLDNDSKSNGNVALIDTSSDTESTFTEYDDGPYSDDSDYEEALTCNVCDRTFSYPKQLAAHKQKKRHFGCSACDSLFTSLMALEHHKEEFEHWSDEDDLCSDESDDEDDDGTVISEECERLL